MSTLIADIDLPKKLAKVTEPVDILDVSGRKLGRFLPEQTMGAEPLVPWDPSITREELDRRAAEAGGMTLAEFWQKMGQK